MQLPPPGQLPEFVQPAEQAHAIKDPGVGTPFGPQVLLLQSIAAFALGM
jgi:hypothetical protein